jgi:hypothetical protein
MAFIHTALPDAVNFFRPQEIFTSLPGPKLRGRLPVSNNPFWKPGDMKYNKGEE